MLAYVFWIAHGIWKGGFDMNGECEFEGRGILASVGAGLVTCFISPYMMILFPLVLPGMMNINTIQMPEFLIVALTTFAALAVGAGLIVGFAAQLRRLVRSPQYVTTVNRSLSSLLVIGGGWMAFG